MVMIHSFKIIFALMVVFFLALPEMAIADDLQVVIETVEVRQNARFSLPVKLRNAEKVAGIKLVLEYDAKLLTYEKTEKTKTTSQLMHVVNDKKPGRLIIVMAGAKGVSGKEIDILSISFKTAANVTGKTVTKVAVSEIELVSEQLQELPCKLSGAEIIILPENSLPENN